MLAFMESYWFVFGPKELNSMEYSYRYHSESNRLIWRLRHLDSLYVNYFEAPRPHNCIWDGSETKLPFTDLAFELTANPWGDE